MEQTNVDGVEEGVEQLEELGADESIEDVLDDSKTTYGRIEDCCLLERGTQAVSVSTPEIEFVGSDDLADNMVRRIQLPDGYVLNLRRDEFSFDPDIGMDRWYEFEPADIRVRGRRAEFDSEHGPSWYNPNSLGDTLVPDMSRAVEYTFPTLRRFAQLRMNLTDQAARGIAADFGGGEENLDREGYELAKDRMWDGMATDFISQAMPYDPTSIRGMLKSSGAQFLPAAGLLKYPTQFGKALGGGARSLRWSALTVYELNEFAEKYDFQDGDPFGTDESAYELSEGLDSSFIGAFNEHIAPEVLRGDGKPSLYELAALAEFQQRCSTDALMQSTSVDELKQEGSTYEEEVTYATNTVKGDSVDAKRRYDETIFENRVMREITNSEVENYYADLFDNIVEIGETEQAIIRDYLARLEPGELQGEVYAGDKGSGDGPIEGVIVRYQERSAVTDEAGEFTLELRPGLRTIELETPLDTTYEAEVEIKGSDTVEEVFELAYVDGVLDGEVFSSAYDTTVPVEDATVVCEVDGEQRETTTDKHGQFELVLPPGRQEIEIIPPDDSERYQYSVKMKPGESTADRRITYESFYIPYRPDPGQLTGTVYACSKESGDGPIEGAVIRAAGESLNAETRTGEEGGYAIELPPSSGQLLEVATPSGIGEVKATGHIRAGRTIKRDFVLESACKGELQGTVKVDISPYEIPDTDYVPFGSIPIQYDTETDGFRHEIDGRYKTTTADDQGEFNMVLPPGGRELTFDLPDEEDNISKETTVRASSSTDDRTITESEFLLAYTPPEATLRATVVLEETNDPIEGLRIEHTEDESRYAMTGPGGQFEMELAPLWEHSLGVVFEDRTFTVERIELQPGETKDIQIEVPAVLSDE